MAVDRLSRSLISSSRHLPLDGLPKPLSRRGSKQSPTHHRPTDLRSRRSLIGLQALGPWAAPSLRARVLCPSEPSTIDRGSGPLHSTAWLLRPKPCQRRGGQCS